MNFLICHISLRCYRNSRRNCISQRERERKIEGERDYIIYDYRNLKVVEHIANEKFKNYFEVQKHDIRKEHREKF